MLLHRKKERRDASSRSLIRKAAPAATSARVALDAKQKLRADEQTLERALDAPRRTRLPRGLLVERQQILDVGVGHRPPVGAAREREQDLRGRTRRLSVGHEKMRRRLGESPGAFAPYGPLIVTSVSAGSVPRDAHARAQRGLVAHFVALDERDADKPRAGFDRRRGIRAPGRARAHLSSAADRARPSSGAVSADRDELRALAVDADLELMRFGGWRRRAGP